MSKKLRCFLKKIYTADKNFTRPPVATVATNSKSGHFSYIFLTFNYFKCWNTTQASDFNSLARSHSSISGRSYEKGKQQKRWMVCVMAVFNVVLKKASQKKTAVLWTLIWTLNCFLGCIHDQQSIIAHLSLP